MPTRARGCAAILTIAAPDSAPPQSRLRAPSRSIGEDGLLRLAAKVGGTDPAGFGCGLIAAMDNEFGLTGATRTDDLTVLVLHHNAADPPPMSVAHKLRMMARMMGL